jgi:hypothetical protein
MPSRSVIVTDCGWSLREIEVDDREMVGEDDEDVVGVAETGTAVGTAVGGAS